MEKYDFPSFISVCAFCKDEGESFISTSAPRLFKWVSVKTKKGIQCAVSVSHLIICVRYFSFEQWVMSWCHVHLDVCIVLGAYYHVNELTAAIYSKHKEHTNRQVEHHIHIMTWKHLSSLLVNNFISIASEASIYLLLLTIFHLFLILHHPILILFLIADLVSSPSSLLWCSSPSSSSFFYSSVNLRNRRCFRAYIDIIVYSQNKR